MNRQFQTFRCQFGDEPIPHLKIVLEELPSGQCLVVSFTSSAKDRYDEDTVLTDGGEQSDPYVLSKLSGFSKHFVTMVRTEVVDSLMANNGHGLLLEKFREAATKTACEGLRDSKRKFPDCREVWFERIGCAGHGFVFS